MSDPIERQAAIDALYRCTDIFINNLPVMVDKAEAYKALAELPSAQPECEDAVSRADVLKINTYHHGEMPNEINHQIWKEIKSLPSVTPKQKTGKWISDQFAFWVCSTCGYPSEAHGANMIYKFCPNCGAKMEVNDDNN